MAKGREYARTNTDIWNDDDFRALPPPAQHLYFVLSTDPTMTACGVADWRPARIAAKSEGWTPTAVYSAAMTLAERQFIVIDEATEEVLLRSYVKHDGTLKVPNSAAAMCTAMAAVASKILRGVMVHELRRLKQKSPKLAGWTGGTSGEKLAAILERDAVDPRDFPTGFPRGGSRIATPADRFEQEEATLPEPEINSSPNPSTTVDSSPVNSRPTPNPYPYPYPYPDTSNEVSKRSPASATRTSADQPEGFDEFWAAYPLRKDKSAAVKAFIKARQSVELEVILAAARRYADDPNRDKGFTKYPATWLNKGSFADEDPLPARSSTPTSASARPIRSQQNHDYLARRMSELGGNGPSAPQLGRHDQLELGA
ncbi:hypothetical protein [Rhodococcoides fascians]|uniref:hypothetical protein n=1 Tax=Rhodococcoides fascians TaxID=1828 RepID=UPI00068CD492|nr:hypothetical protein [Rhodococcus fascians]